MDLKEEYKLQWEMAAGNFGIFPNAVFVPKHLNGFKVAVENNSIRELVVIGNHGSYILNVDTGVSQTRGEGHWREKERVAELFDSAIATGIPMQVLTVLVDDIHNDIPPIVYDMLLAKTKVVVRSMLNANRKYVA